MKRLGFLRSFLACKRSSFGRERFFCLPLQHNAVSVAAADFGGFFVFMLDYQPHPLHPLTMFKAGGDYVDSRRVDAAVAEDVCQLYDVLFYAVEHPCKQMAQVVRKDLLRVDAGFFTQAFHLPPDVGAAHGLAGAGDKNCAACDVLLRDIAEQFLLQGLDEKDCPCFALERYDRFAVFDRLYRNKLQLAHPDSRAADRLQNEVQPFVVLLLRRPAKAFILRFGQFLSFRAKDLPLYF